MVRRLRSRDGCDRCRTRRKKCDEHHPICHACARWNLLCTWSKRGIPGVGQRKGPSRAYSRISGKDGGPIITRLPALSCHQDGMLANGYQAFSDDRQFYLASTCPLILSYILNPFATGQGRDTSRYTSLVLLDLSVRSAWVAFAGKLLTFQDSFPVNALRNYYAAVAGTRKTLETRRDPSRIFPLVAAMLFMGFYEIYGNGNPDTAFIHITAILVLASDLLDNYQLTLAQPEYICLKLSIEWAFFAVANTAIYQPDLSTFRRINWPLLNNFVNDTSTPCHTLPFLRGKAEIYSLLCQVMALAREPHSYYIKLQLMSLSQRLNEIDSHPPLKSGIDVPPNLEKMINLRWPFLVRSVRIYLLIALYQRACSGSSFIRALVSQSLDSLILMDVDSEVNSRWAIWPLPHSARQFGVQKNQGMFSHLAILMSAIHEIEDMEILEGRIQSMVGDVPWLHHNRMQKCRQIIQERKRNNLISCNASSNTECNIVHDGLDFLLHKNGMFGILDQIDEAVPLP